MKTKPIHFIISLLASVCTAVVAYSQAILNSDS
jgi:hypothetical protein